MARLTAILDDGPDEVLVVGHSSGAYLAVSLMADLLRERVDPGLPPSPWKEALRLARCFPSHPHLAM